MENLKEVFKESKSILDVCKRLGYSANGRGYKKVKDLISEHGFDVTHFDGGASKRTVHQTITKECPSCGKEFKTKEGDLGKTTCSYSCSNSYFRSGEDNPNYKNIDEIDDVRSAQYSKKYRQICFKHHQHVCCVCGEYKLLDVHHFDGNKRNNKPENLIPICATHHNYVHSEYKHEVIDKIITYRDSFIKNRLSGGDQGK